MNEPKSLNPVPIWIQFEESILDSLFWDGNLSPASISQGEIFARLADLKNPIYVIQKGNEVSLTSEGKISSINSDSRLKGFVGPLLPEHLGDESFKSTYGVRYALYAGAMANAIASEELVIAMGNAGFMGSFGAGGLLPERIELAIERIQGALTNKPYAFNLINSPFEPALEQHTAELYLRKSIDVIEASAYLILTDNLVWYRAAGLKQAPDGSIVIGNRIIAKLSRKEMARKFLGPAPEDILSRLMHEGKITEQQANLARFVPMADDITVEADSGGHTDNRPLVNLIPSMLALRDEFQLKYQYAQSVRVGAAGGIATPASALAAFAMGAAYLVTGSINQACLEAGASEHTKQLLSQAEMTDVAMAPASDMFEMGVKVQVLKRGTMFAMRAQKLYELYSRFDSLEEIPPAEREKIETTIFQESLDKIWEHCLKFFSERDPGQIERANRNPKAKMALVFRWYLGLSSRWSNCAEKGREMDYQIWCGPAMGAFNDWVRGTYLENPANRHIEDIAIQILNGSAYLQRLRMLEAQGIRFSPELHRYNPVKKV